ncbi:potassium channel family protein [Haliangium ochraceum]|uniref:TrkA-N domain protein n=1 Tax=Haliangium ochraceum (strain DSM 14365 / JCM 11303 / SMP-2) TaxID=502025 RepID=D0LZP9_HALO1|nr:potassium channel protein [Haliangium ochraceum]ACY18028.1 TrkA-N domain protein [Haliangium ochraceum DSM 14365]
MPIFYPMPSGSPGKRVGLAVSVLAVLTIVGTSGFMFIEDLDLLEGLYMTVTTLSTVGYGEVHPFSPAGRGFATGLIVFGLGTALYTVGAVGEYFIEGRLGGLLHQRAMNRTLDQLEQHVILCGFGRLGHVVADELLRSGAQLVVIDSDPELEPTLMTKGLPYLIDSALEEEALTRAGIARARAIVITTPTDADSVFVTLSARQLNPELVIYARAESETGARRLRLAGAHQVIQPHLIGGQRIANALLRPAVVDFIELSSPGSGPEIDMEELVVGPGSMLDGHGVEALSFANIEAVVVAVQRPGEPMRVSPSTNQRYRAGDRVVVVGERAELRRLATRAQGS